MTTMNKRVLAAVFGLTLMSGLAWAGGPGRGMRELVERLDLNDKQMKMVEELREDTRAFHDAQKAEKDRIADEVLVELAKARPDAQRIHDLVDEGVDATRAGLHERVDALLKFQGTLSEEQRAELVAGLEELRAEREAHHEEMRRRGEGPEE